MKLIILQRYKKKRRKQPPKLCNYIENMYKQLITLETFYRKQETEHLINPQKTLPLQQITKHEIFST